MLTSRLPSAFFLMTLLISLFSLPIESVEAQERRSVEATEGSDTGRITVATKEAPPFAMKMQDGSWHGISIDLWKEVAREIGLEYAIVEDDLEGILEGVANGEYDVGVAAISITSKREETLDFSQAYYQSGLGIAVNSSGHGGWLGLAMRLISWQFISVIGALLVLLAIVGFLIWLVERKKNPEQFGGRPWHGIGSGFWWSAVTMTTVGYGDKAPVTFLGRLIGLIWMFAAIIIISSFTAAIAASLTVSELGNEVTGPKDLPNVTVGAVAESTGGAWLGERSIGYRQFESLEDGMSALASGDISALVYDAPMLHYAARHGYDGEIGVLPETFNKEFYGIALREKSPLREEVNRALLLHAQGPEWQGLLARYIGEN